VPSTATLRRRAAVAAAQPFGGVLSRCLLRERGIDRHAVAREVAADRWRAHGGQTIAVHTQELGIPALWWRAVWEVGCRSAALDGASALIAAGVTGYDSALVHVSVPDAFSPSRVSGVRPHRVQRVEGEVILNRGVPRVAPALAAVRAAHWAVSDRQAALLLVLPVQQGIVSGAQLVAASRAVSGRRRRALVPQLVLDITDGARSLGELDFATMCRRRGLPEPDRQTLRRTARGNAYLDVEWRQCGLVVEIDGSQHTAGLALVVDHLRQNEITLQRGRVLRISLLGLRVSADAFLEQVARGLFGSNWSAFRPPGRGPSD
jgi:very-short-patch-repair endonuclease